MTKFLSLAAFAAALCLSLPLSAHEGVVHEGCAPGQAFMLGDITVTGAFSRAMPPRAKVGGGYFTIENKGAAPDRLLAARSQAAPAVTLHSMRMDGEIMRMREIEDGVEIPAGGAISFTPSGMHVMLTGVTQPFKEGECVELVLAFERAGELAVVLNVGAMAADVAPEGHAHH